MSSLVFVLLLFRLPHFDFVCILLVAVTICISQVAVNIIAFHYLITLLSLEPDVSLSVCVNMR